MAPTIAPSFGEDTFAKTHAANTPASGAQQVDLRKIAASRPITIPARIEKTDRCELMFIFITLFFD
jgi:hypothetical protein